MPSTCLPNDKSFTLQVMYYSNNLIDRSDSQTVNKKVHETRFHNLGKPAFPIRLKADLIQVYSFAKSGPRKKSFAVCCVCLSVFSFFSLSQ